MRLSAFIVVITATVCAITAVACDSGDDGDGGPSPTTSAATAPGGRPPSSTSPARTAQPTATSAPTNTPTPEATATPEPLVFTASDASGGSATPRRSGPLGIVYADATWERGAGSNRVGAAAWVNVGVNERPSASAWLSNNFRVPGDGSAVAVQISADVKWSGVLAGNGAGGTGASVKIVLEIFDGQGRVEVLVVHTKELRESALSIGGADDVGSEAVALQANLKSDHVYALRLTVTCEAYSGIIGAATHCIFGESDVYDDGYIEWGTRTISFVP